MWVLGGWEATGTGVSEFLFVHSQGQGGQAQSFSSPGQPVPDSPESHAVSVARVPRAWQGGQVQPIGLRGEVTKGQVLPRFS